MTVEGLRRQRLDLAFGFTGLGAKARRRPARARLHALHEFPDMRKALIDIGNADDREHVDPRPEGDIGKRELVAAQPGTAIGKLTLHHVHLFKQDQMTFRQQRVVAWRGQDLGREADIGFVFRSLADFLTQLVR